MPDALTKLPSRLFSPTVTAEKGNIGSRNVSVLASGLPPIPPDTKPYFTADIPSQLVSIIMNDWPYSGRCTRFCLMPIMHLSTNISSPSIHRALLDMDYSAYYPRRRPVYHQDTLAPRWLVGIHGLRTGFAPTITVATACLPSCTL